MHVVACQILACNNLWLGFKQLVVNPNPSMKQSTLKLSAHVHHITLQCQPQTCRVREEILLSSCLWVSSSSSNCSFKPAASSSAWRCRDRAASFCLVSSCTFSWASASCDSIVAACLDNTAARLSAFSQAA